MNEKRSAKSKAKLKQTEIKWTDYVPPAGRDASGKKLAAKTVTKKPKKKARAEPSPVSEKQTSNGFDKLIPMPLGQSPRFTLEAAQSALKGIRSAAGPAPFGPVSDALFKAAEAAVNVSLARWEALEKHFAMTFTMELSVTIPDDPKQSIRINEEEWRVNRQKPSHSQER